MKRHIYALSAVLTIISSCIKESGPADEYSPSEGYTVILEGEDSSDTKSAITSETGLSRCRMGIYLEGRLILDTGITGSSAGIGRLEKNTAYDVFAVSGPLATNPFPALEQDAESAVYDLSFSGAYPDFAAYGAANPEIPMAAVIKGMTPHQLDISDGAEDGVIKLSLERLFSRIRLTVTADDRIRNILSTTSLGSIKIHGAPSVTDPFGNGGNIDWETVPVWADGDLQTGPLSFDTEYTLYIPENLQGVIHLNSPSEKSRNNLEKIVSAEKLMRLTYIETSATFVHTGGDGGEVVYRFYPGSNDTDSFDILRSGEYNLTLSLTYDNIYSGGDWKIDTDGYSDTRSLRFTNPYRLYFNDKDAFLCCHYSDKNSSSNLISPIQGISYGYRSEYVFGTEEEIDRWVEDNSNLPQEYPIVQARQLSCLTCGSIFQGYPLQSASSDERWAFFRELAVAQDAGGGVIRYGCPMCGAKWHTEGSVNLTSTLISRGTSGQSESIKVSSRNMYYVKIHIPADASEGDIITYWIATKDGILKDRADLLVALPATASTSLEMSRDRLYLGETEPVTARFIPLMSDGNQVPVSFTIRSGSDVISLQSRDDESATVKAIGTGNAVIVCKNSDTGEELATKSVEIRCPSIVFFNSTVYSTQATEYDIHPDGSKTRVLATLTDDNGDVIKFKDTAFAGEIYSSAAFTLSVSSGGTGTVLETEGATNHPDGSRILSGYVSLASFSGINPRYSDGEYIPATVALTCTLRHSKGNISASVPVRIKSILYSTPPQTTRYIYHKRKTGTYCNESGAAISLGSINYPAIVNWKDSGSGLGVVGLVDQPGSSSGNGITWKSGSSGTCLNIDNPTSQPHLYQYPATYSLRCTVTNSQSGESVSWDYAKVVLSEFLDVGISWEEVHKNTFWHRAKNRLYIDESGFTANGQFPMPFSFSDYFDCTLHSDSDYLDFMKYYRVWCSVNYSTQVKESNLSYMLYWDGYEKDGIPGKVGEATIENYIDWFAPDLCFHRKGSPSVREFDVYTDSFGIQKNYTGIPKGEPVIWLHFTNTVNL